MTTADLGYPILFFILVLWGLFAILAILTTLMKQGKFPGHMKNVFHRYHGTSHRRKHTH